MPAVSSAASGASRSAALLLAAVGLGLIGWVLSGDVRITGGPGIGLTEIAVVSLGLLNVLLAGFRSRWVPAVLLLQCSLAVTLVLAEFALRMTLSHRYYAPFQLDDRYLYELIPGVRREHRILPVNGGANLYRVNSLGFRGEDFSREPSGRPRVVIYGDSFIQAEFTSLDNTLAQQLQQRLTAQTGLPVEVINAGVAGYGPDQALRRIEDELGWLQPDVLILAVFTGNDFGDLLRNKIYRIGPNGDLLDNDYSFSETIRLNAKLDQVEFITRRVVREATHTLLAMLREEQTEPFNPQRAIERALQQHLDEYEDYVVAGNNTIRELRSDPYSADISLLPDSPSGRYKIELMAGVLRQAAAAAAAAGVPLLVVGIPHPMDVLDGDHASGYVDRTRFPLYNPDRQAAKYLLARRKFLCYF